MAEASRLQHIAEQRNPTGVLRRFLAPVTNARQTHDLGTPSIAATSKRSEDVCSCLGCRARIGQRQHTHPRKERPLEPRRSLRTGPFTPKGPDFAGLSE